VAGLVVVCAGQWANGAVVLCCWLTHVVVVPDNEPGRGSVGQLKVGVGLVLSVPLPVVGERPRLRPHDLANVRGLAGVLVLVVAQVKDQIGVILGKPLVGREVPLPVVRTRGETHGERPTCVMCRSGQSASSG
jgi:hypothetical protein